MNLRFILVWAGFSSSLDGPASSFVLVRQRWVWACPEPQQRHVAGVSTVHGSFLQKALSFSFALLNFLGDGMDSASFAFTCFFFPDQNDCKKKLAFPSVPS